MIDAVGSYQRILNKKDEKYLVYRINQSKLTFAVLKKKKSQNFSDLKQQRHFLFMLFDHDGSAPCYLLSSIESDGAASICLECYLSYEKE